MFQRWLYKNYRISSGFRHRVKRVFTPAGVWVAVAAVACAAIGIDTNEAVAYQVFTLLAAMLVISFFLRFSKGQKIVIERSVPRYGTVGQALKYQVRVQNMGTKIARGFTLFEDLGDPRPTFEQFLNNPEPEEQKRNAWDRMIRFYRWSWLLERNKIAQSSEVIAPATGPGERVELTAEIVPSRRGLLKFQGISVAWPDPLGLFRGFTSISLPGKALILPKRYLLPNLTLPGKKEHQPGGVALASSVGDSEEFVALREYRRGDPLRHVHWNSVARTGKLIVKEFQDEYFVRHALVLDTFLEAGMDESFEEAISLAASLAYTIRSQESLLDLLFIGPEAYCLTSGRGTGNIEHVLEVLAAVQPCTSGPFEQLRDLVMRHLQQVSGCICILLGWDERRKELVQQLRVYQLPLLVLVVSNETNEPQPVDRGSCQIRFLQPGKIEESLAKL
ncbi:MAG: DUF58 domain-containing protein [Verrucomicrobiota bacterium]|nr:DUF58 domain-containing protein [Verrucomicrobiota bacterium]